MDLDTEQKELTSSSSKCANCASELFFDPKSKGLKCNSCGSIFNFPITVSNEKHDLNLSKQSFDTDNWAEENKMVNLIKKKHVEFLKKVLKRNSLFLQN